MARSLGPVDVPPMGLSLALPSWAPSATSPARRRQRIHSEAPTDVGNGPDHLVDQRPASRYTQALKERLNRHQPLVRERPARFREQAAGAGEGHQVRGMRWLLCRNAEACGAAAGFAASPRTRGQPPPRSSMHREEASAARPSEPHSFPPAAGHDDPRVRRHRHMLASRHAGCTVARGRARGAFGRPGCTAGRTRRPASVHTPSMPLGRNRQSDRQHLPAAGHMPDQPRPCACWHRHCQQQRRPRLRTVLGLCWSGRAASPSW
jgi:hypothetical protein